MKRLLYTIALILAVITAVGYGIGKEWEMDKREIVREMSKEERLVHLRAQADQGNIDAFYELGQYYDTQKSDYIEAQKWYRAAATKGNHAGAQFKLGHLYVNGRGVENDLAIAMDWFRRSARQGDPRGYFFLGIAARDGWERKADPVLAYQWLWLAHQGHDVLRAENSRFDTARALEELEVRLSQFSIDKARRQAKDHPLKVMP